jgi:type II secretory pathway pseudopilin PulG
MRLSLTRNSLASEQKGLGVVSQLKPIPARTWIMTHQIFSRKQRNQNIKMKIKIRAHTRNEVRNARSLRTPHSAFRTCSGFTLMETVVATLITGIMLPTLYTGLASSFSTVQATRENLRATQILVQRMEAVRLAPYKTLQDAAAYPTNSTEYYSPSGQTNGSGGAAYTVTYNWVPAPSTLPPSYRTNMMLVTVTASWNSGNVPRTRSMQSYVARYGVQRYVSGN